MSDDLANSVIRRWERLDGSRGAWKSHCQEVADYMQPDRADFTIQRSPGVKRMSKVFDAAPIWAAEQFAAGLHSRLTSPTLIWFSLKTEDDSLMQADGVQAWLDDTTQRLYALFNSPRHNFASQSHELYRDLGLFGLGIMSVLENDRNDVLFSTRHLRECVIAENDEDRVDTLVRRWTYTARQAVDAWGDRCGEKVRAAAAETPDRTFSFLHAVQPRRDRDPQRADAKHKPFASVYVGLDDKCVISEGGFDEFPFLAPRLDKISGEVHGRGRGMMALPDVKMLNKMQELIIKSAQKIIDPPLMIPDDGFLTGIKTTPGGQNYYRAGSNDRIEPLRTGGDVNLGVALLSRAQQSVIRAFDVDFMLMPTDPSDPASAGKGVTATYTVNDRDQKAQMQSPMLARLQGELLGPLIDRVFAIQWRRAKAMRFGPGAPMSMPPPALSGAKLRVEYVSPIAVAQKANQIDGMMRLVQVFQMLKQADPQMVNPLDTDAILRLVGRDLNTPALAIKSADRVAQETQQAAEAQAQMNDHAALANVAGAAKDGASAMKNMAQAQQMAAPANDSQPPAQQGAA